MHEEKMSCLEDFPRNNKTEQFDDCSSQGTVRAIVLDIKETSKLFWEFSLAASLLL